jgi:hypothetical protein
MAETKEQRLEQLRALRDDPPARAAYAATLLQPRMGLEVVRTALRALIAHPYLPARPALHSLYDHYAASGVQRDPGTYVRSEIVRALRPLVEPGDVPLLENALTTYEFPPPSFTEEAALLRSGALVTLVEIDDLRARYHATRLLADPLTDRMSGEPALTAASVLAAQGELLPLYFYVTQDFARMQGEVAAACLRGLGEMPQEALPPLVKHFAECEQPVILVGLVDLLIAKSDAPIAMPTLAELMERVADLDLFRYLAAVLLAAPQPDLRGLVGEAAGTVRDRGKQQVLLVVLEEAGDAPDLVAARELLKGRMGPEGGTRTRTRQKS